MVMMKKGADNKAVQDFWRFLQSQAAKDIMIEYGFLTP